MNWIKRHPIMLAVLMLPLLFGGANYSGMCISEMRWLSDEEKVRLVLARINSQESAIVKIPSNSNNRVSVIRVPYESIDKMLESNPNCCQVYSSNHFGDDYVPMTFTTKILGKHSSNIVTPYKVYYEYEGQAYSQNIKITPLISNCGEVRIGMWH